MTEITFITSVAPYHKDLLQRAINSVEAQTVKCEHLIYYDGERRGPAYGRNALLQQVKTPYVVILDADDWINPVFAERTLAHIKPGHYVYTDWWNDETRKEAPALPWCGGKWHIMTSLLPTDWARGIGGFDELLPAAEDTDFYMRLCAAGLCGLHLPEPLFHYGGEGMRAKAFYGSDQHEPTMLMIRDRYKGIMGCCGQKTQPVTPPPNEEFEGAVLARAIYVGNRQERGYATGILYDRAGNGSLIWVHRDDIALRRNHWEEVQPPAPPDTKIIRNGENHAQATAPAEGVHELAAAVERVWNPHRQDEPSVTSATPASVEPDVRAVIALGRRSGS